jgi:hypothetical protein
VQEIVDAREILGLTLAIADLTGPAELGSWGIKLYQVREVREWYQHDHRRTLNYLEASNALMEQRYAL